MGEITSKRNALYQRAVADCGDALERVARAYEADPDKRKDLLQEIHVGLWLSLDNFEGRCSLRTWVHRVAHNIAVTIAIRRNARSPDLVDLAEVEAELHDDGQQSVELQDALDRVWTLIHQLKPQDRQLMPLYLEGVDAASIGEITGLSSGNVATRIHRIKHLLSHRFHQGARRVQ